MVGARDVVHTPQFNGKQKFSLNQVHLLGTWPELIASLRCPRNGQANETRQRVSALSYVATGCPEQASGKADKVVFASPDTGQQGVVARVATA
jgi:hypothetical protein